VVGSDVIAHDITERKRAEDALRVSEARFKSIVSTSQEWIWAADTDGLNTFSNPAIENILGYHPDEIVRRSAAQNLILEEDIPRMKELMARSIEQKAGWSNIVLRWKHKDGTYRHLESNAVPILDSAGVLKGFQGSDRDITERKRAEEEKRSLEERLNRAEKMEALGQLAGGVAHDLNNVLGILSGYSELLLMEIPEGSSSRGHIEKILQSTEKGAAIIQDLLTLARLGVTASDVINLNSVVSGFLKTPVFEKMKDYHPRVTFKAECDQNLLNIKGSSVHLEKTLMNLVSNAAESISGKGEVTIRTESRYLDKPILGYDDLKEGDYAVLTVSDTGMGIPAENREKIFEPFYTKKTMGRSGTGLGLAIVWGTVKDHNGYIDLQTEVGEGTTFTLYFPVTREELIVTQQKVPVEQYMGKGESVLVVDDIAEQRDVASRLLTQLGYEVHVVSGGEEAVEYLKGNKADILVLDMIMAPGIDGLETYEQVLKVNPTQKAILVSGFSETERIKKARKLGAGSYVKKPYIMEKIGIAIREELNRK
jgi:PAS domain S-box-containing protein